MTSLDPILIKEESSLQRIHPKQNKRDDNIFQNKDSENIDQKSVMVSQSINQKTVGVESHIAETVYFRHDSEGYLYN